MRAVIRPPPTTAALRSISAAVLTEPTRARPILSIAALSTHPRILSLLMTPQPAEATVLTPLPREARIPAKPRTLLSCLLRRRQPRRTRITIRRGPRPARLAQRRRRTGFGRRIHAGIGFQARRALVAHALLLRLAVATETRRGAREGVVHTAEAGSVLRGRLRRGASVVVEATSKAGTHTASGAHAALLVLAKSGGIRWGSRVLLLVEGGVVAISGGSAVHTSAGPTLLTATWVASGLASVSAAEVLAESELILIGLLIRGLVVRMAVRVAGGLAVAALLGVLLLLLLLNALVLSVRLLLLVLLLAAEERVGSVVAGARGVAEARLCLFGQVVRIRRGIKCFRVGRCV